MLNYTQSRVRVKIIAQQDQAGSRCNIPVGRIYDADKLKYDAVTYYVIKCDAGAHHRLRASDVEEVSPVEVIATSNGGLTTVF